MPLSLFMTAAAPRVAASLIIPVLFGFTQPGAFAQAAFMTGPNSIVGHDIGAQRSVRGPVTTEREISQVWGAMADGRVLATLQHQHDHEHPEDNLEGHSHDVAGPLVALGTDGTVADTLITSDVLRAFISPARDAVAAITPARELVIWRAAGAGEKILVEAPGTVSHVSWSPDGARLAAAIYPPDYSPHAMDNPGTVENFHRLQDSDIYLIDAVAGTILSRLTNNPGTDYNPFFSPDGKELYYVWLHETENAGGLMRLRLDLDGGTSASAGATQITMAGEDIGKVPLGRVGTYLFVKGTQSLVFEAGLPDGSGEIWSMRADGSGARFVAKGRKPQVLTDGSLAILAPSRTVQILSSAEISR